MRTIVVSFWFKECEAVINFRKECGDLREPGPSIVASGEPS